MPSPVNSKNHGEPHRHLTVACGSIRLSHRERFNTSMRRFGSIRNMTSNLTGFYTLIPNWAEKSRSMMAILSGLQN